MTKQTSKQYFQTLTILFFAMLTGQVLFIFIALYLIIGKQIIIDSSLQSILTYLVPIFIIGSILIGQMIYKSFLSRLKLKRNLMEKMNGYKSALILKLAFIEGATLFAIVSYILTGDILFIAIAGISILYNLTLKPNISKIAIDLELNTLEKKQIEDPEETIAEYQ